MNYICESIIIGNHDKNCENDVDNDLHYSSGETSPVWADFIDAINNNILETELERELKPNLVHDLVHDLETELSNYLENDDLEHNELNNPFYGNIFTNLDIKDFQWLLDNKNLNKMQILELKEKSLFALSVAKLSASTKIKVSKKSKLTKKTNFRFGLPFIDSPEHNKHRYLYAQRKHNFLKKFNFEELCNFYSYLKGKKYYSVIYEWFDVNNITDDIIIKKYFRLAILLQNKIRASRTHNTKKNSQKFCNLDLDLDLDL
jgi:hypothetical protein